MSTPRRASVLPKDVRNRMTAQEFSGPALFDGVISLESAFLTALDEAPDAVLVLDSRRVVTHANSSAESLLGRPLQEIVERPVARLLRDPQALNRMLTSLSPGDRVCDRDLGLRRADGSAVRVSVSASCVAFPHAADRIVLYLRDVRERLQVEDELRRRNEELEHCVNTLSHDLRSPLVALLGFSRLLRQDYETHLDDTGVHFLERIEQAGRTMEDLIHDLLELSRIDQPGDRRALVDPRAVLLQLQAEFKPRLEVAGIRLELPADPQLVYCDRTRLYQLFSNLIGNAIEHMGPCEDPYVAVEVHDEVGHHRISVRDPGRGIDPEHHERIFRVFESLGKRADGQRGTGIGLAIVRKIADTHEGRAWVESRPGEGATFHVTLPKKR